MFAEVLAADRRCARSAVVACEGSKAYQVADMEGAPLYVPVCADHAQTWFTERDHLHGGMDAACIVCAHVTQSATEPLGTFACPHCGEASPHRHEPSEVAELQARKLRAAKEMERRRLHPSPDATQWPDDAENATHNPADRNVTP
jgi:predicted RNA-binding Zn-ribbon protein involved in translation (DUF1610 family)